MRKRNRNAINDLTDREVREAVRRIQKLNEADTLLIRVLEETEERLAGATHITDEGGQPQAQPKAA